MFRSFEKKEKKEKKKGDVLAGTDIYIHIAACLLACGSTESQSRHRETYARP